MVPQYYSKTNPQLDAFVMSSARLEGLEKEEDQALLRELMISLLPEAYWETLWDYPYLDNLTIVKMARDLRTVWDYPYNGREVITELALSYSLCPIHFIDYAICFDDQPDDCAQVRLIHPGHDT